jgi:hypothetical protein
MTLVDYRLFNGFRSRVGRTCGRAERSGVRHRAGSIDARRDRSAPIGPGARCRTGDSVSTRIGTRRMHDSIGLRRFADIRRVIRCPRRMPSSTLCVAMRRRFVWCSARRSEVVRDKTRALTEALDEFESVSVGGRFFGLAFFQARRIASSSPLLNC